LNQRRAAVSFLQRIERAAKRRNTAPWLAAHGDLPLRQVRTLREFVEAQLTAPTPFAFGLTTGRMLFATGPYREALAVNLAVPPERYDLANERAELHWNGLDNDYLDSLSVGREMGSLADLIESHRAAPDDFENETVDSLGDLILANEKVLERLEATAR